MRDSHCLTLVVISNDPFVFSIELEQAGRRTQPHRTPPRDSSISAIMLGYVIAPDL
jgi:hypothetical protein